VKIKSVAGTPPVPSKVGAKGSLTVSTSVSLADSAALEVSGDYVLNNGVTGTNAGTVTVKSGGVIHNGTGISITGGNNVVEAGGTVYFSGDVLFIGSGSHEAVFLLGPGAKFSFDKSGYELDGTAILNTGNNDAKDKFVIEATEHELKLTENSTLTVKSGITLAVTRGGDGNRSTDPAVVGDTGARLIVNGILDVSADTANTNFYQYDGTTKELSTATGKTYTWATNLGGGGVTGWKAGS
jgi:hypothetical protein